MRTVVHFVDSDAFGGTEKIILTLLSGLNQDRWRPVLFHHPEATLEPLLEESRRIGVQLRDVPRMRGSSRLSGMVKFHRLLRAERPSVFHAHLNWPLACRAGLAVAASARVPAVVATTQVFVGPPRCPRSFSQRAVWRTVDRFIAVSEDVARGLRRVSRLPATKIRVIRNGIPLAIFDRPVDRMLRSTLSRGSQWPLVLTPARLHEQKGHKYLLQAAAMVPEVMFVLAGDGPLRTELEKQARSLSLEERVIFLGHRDDIPDLLAATDMFVLPSLFEGYPLSVMEAAAAGKPIVATAVGGTDEAICSGQTGLLVPPADPWALANAIRTLLANPAFSADLARAAKMHARREYSADTMCRRTIETYEEVLTSRGVI